MMHKTIAYCLQQARTKLQNSSDSPALDAELLLAQLLAQPRSFLFSHSEYKVSSTIMAQYDHWIQQRQQGKPIAYLLGYQDFWDFQLSVNPHVLIPRPETECLIERVLEQLPASQPLKIVDLGTGSGAIALTLARERPHWEIHATDKSPAALAVAAHNAKQLGITAIQWHCCSWLEKLDGDFDLIVSNPPYIATQDTHLNAINMLYEPQMALVAGHNGLQDIMCICQQAPQHLAEDGWLFLEHGYDQQTAINTLLNTHCWQQIHNYRDLAGIPRIVAAKFQTKICT